MEHWHGEKMEGLHRPGVAFYPSPSECNSRHLQGCFTAYIYIMTPWGLAKPSDIWAPDIELFTFLTFSLFIYLAVSGLSCSTWDHFIVACRL